MAYKKGIETKERILETSKELFYQYGYLETTISLIAKSADVNPGLIPYYFNHKREIAGIIFTQISMDINKIVKETLAGKYEPEVLWILEIWIYYKLIFTNSNLEKFYFELSEERITQECYKPIVYDLTLSHCMDAHLAIDENEFRAISSIIVGAKVELVTDKIKNLYPITYDQIARHIFHIILHLCGYSKEKEEQYCTVFYEAKELINVYMGDGFRIFLEESK